MLKGRYQLLKGYQNNHVTIGFGSYGQVKLARNLDNGEIVAVKIVPSLLKKQINKLAKNQIIFHDKLFHPKIIQLLNYQIDKERQITYMVLEYADDGTLFEKIKTSPLNKSQIKKYFKDVCEAISYLHGKQIMHRDIKPQNILLTKKGQAKLCDFGFAAILGERKTLCGTYEYMSPEMIQNRSYDYKIDIWALGILLFEMIAGQAPFRGESPEEVLNQMKTKIYFCESLIKMILRVTPHKRPTVQDILGHPYLNDDGKTVTSEETEISQAKKLASISSNSNLETGKEVQKGQNLHFNKKYEASENTKQPQNSFPFYVPKAKYNTGGSTGSTGNSGSGASTKIIMPEHFSSKFENGSKNDLVSPKKRDYPDVSNGEEGAAKNTVFKYNGNLYQGVSSNNLGSNSYSTTSFKGLNFSMGAEFKQKFRAMHGQEIGELNKESQGQKKGGHGVNGSVNKTFLGGINRTASNRFS